MYTQGASQVYIMTNAQDREEGYKRLFSKKKGMDTNKWLMQKKNSHHQTLVRMKSSGNSLWVVQQLWENVHQLLRKHTPAQRFCS